MSVLVEYPGGWTCSFEASLAPGARGLGVEFLGTEGRLYIDRNRYTFTANSGETETGGVEHDITRDHVRNFVASVRARTVPNAPVLTSHRSTLTSHLANLAYLADLRARGAFDETIERFLRAAVLARKSIAVFDGCDYRLFSSFLTMRLAQYEGDHDAATVVERRLQSLGIEDPEKVADCYVPRLAAV